MLTFIITFTLTSIITNKFSQVYDEGSDGAEAEGEVFQLQWGRLYYQGYGRQRLVQVIE